MISEFSDEAQRDRDGTAEILCVDDCQMNILALTSLLKQFNYQSDVAVDGQEAIEAVEQRANATNAFTQGDEIAMYKLILMDFSMPVCDGPTAVKAIRSFLTEKGYSKEQ